MYLRIYAKIYNKNPVEIDIHRKNQEELKQQNKTLQQEVQTLLRDPKTNSRLQMFPEFFPQREK